MTLGTFTLIILSQIKLRSITKVNSFAIEMKSITIIFLISLYTLSFIGDSGLLSISKKASIQVCDDMDSEEEVKEAKKDKSPLAFYQTSSLKTIVPNPILITPTVSKLVDVDHAVDIQPPRA